MQGDMVGLVAGNFVLRLFLARMMHVSFIDDILCMHLDDVSANAPSL